MSYMRRVADPAAELAWFADSPPEDAVTGYDATGWPASTWVLHSMYENPDLQGLGTHDDLHRWRLETGETAPQIIGDVNFDSVGTVTGIPLGFVARPGQAWRRITWEAYLARFPNFAGRRDVPPCYRWFPPESWPVGIEPPPEGSLDEESLDALLAKLADHSVDGADTRCYAFFASLAAGDYDAVHLWEGPLHRVPDLISGKGGPYDCSPTNLWPADHSWFVMTDCDLQATKVSGDLSLVEALASSSHLECLDWPSTSG